ncbi:methionyl-tRNA formyltransferase [Nitrosospira briensis]|uniref:Methionyl-tRNA formyltransferase n=1 Tax=Nitrosospira briensis TaxID=35799 RepID=A0A1I5AP29_9PROT|nr:methionyl-tRNA formyltransferase [Nitrosospira briensis]SFN64203.1 methionyl-tRNA formyltransferase [Nitrosospira briensis]
MRIIFAGTPPFAAPALQSLLNAGHEVALVLTQPDRPAGRGMRTASSVIKLLAQEYKLALLQPHSLKQPELHGQLDAAGADIMVVAAYGIILPSAILSIPRLGCLNVHASLLPRWRGAAPIQRAILAGDRETGITIMQMDRGLDTGAMLLQKSIPIEQDDSAQTLHDKLALLGAQCIVEALAFLQQGKLHAIPQDETAATYASKPEKYEAEIDWRLDAENINRTVRAFNPRPGAHSRIAGAPMKIWQASTGTDSAGKPGEIVAVTRHGIVVACGEGSLVLEIVQKSGGKKLSAAEFLSGHPLRPGDRFERRE